MDLRLVWNELGHDAAETQRLLAECGAHPFVTGGRRVTLVEHQVDDLQHRCQTGGELGSPRDLEGHACFGKCPLGADDSLSNGRLRDEKCVRNLLRRQTSQKAECESDARIGRENRMAGCKHEAEDVVAYLFIE